MGVRVAEGRIKRTKSGARIVKFSEDVAKARARVDDYFSGNHAGDDGSMLQSAMADLRAQNEELLVADEELRVQSEELVRSQRRTEVERRRYRDLFDLAPDAHFVTDRHGAIQEANSAASGLLAIEPRFLRGKPLSSFVSAADSKALHGALDTLQRQSSVDVELTLTGRGDEKKRVAFRAVRMTDPLFYIWSARRAREAGTRVVDGNGNGTSARERQFAPPVKDQSLGLLSQELERSLQSILTWTKTLRRSDISDEEKERGLKTIERHAEKQAEIVDTLFDLSSLVAHNLTLSRAPVDLADVVSLGVESMRVDAVASNIELAADIRGPIQILGDPLRLEQITTNLLAHTMKGVPTGARITIGLEVDNEGALLSMSDNATAPQSAASARISDWLAQGTEHSPDGVGVGLYMVRALTELHGGTMSIRGNGGAAGITFVIRLPVLES